MKDTVTITVPKKDNSQQYLKKAYRHSKNYVMFTFSIEIPAIKLSLCCKSRMNQTNLKLGKKQWLNKLIWQNQSDQPEIGKKAMA
jgi:hypothetical protein